MESTIPADKEIPLTDKQKLRIYQAIGQRMTADDKEPRLVIKEDYGGNEDLYLRCMAVWLGIDLN